MFNRHTVWMAIIQITNTWVIPKKFGMTQVFVISQKHLKANKGTDRNGAQYDVKLCL